MFQFTGFPPIKLLIHLMVLKFELQRVSPFGFLRFNWCLVHSTQLIADMHVLRRLSVPRHPPLALCSFTYSLELALLLDSFFNIDDLLRIYLSRNLITFILSLSLLYAFFYAVVNVLSLLQ